MLDRGLRLLIGLSVGAWVARYLGPAQYGELAYVLAYLAFFQVAATLGADSIVVRDIARKPEAASEILGTVLALRTGTGMLCWLLAVAGAVLMAPEDPGSVWLIALAGGAIAFQAADTVDLWFQSKSQSRRTVVAKLTAYLISNGAKVGFVLTEAPLAAFAASVALDGLCAAIGLSIAYRRLPTTGRWTSVAARAKTLLKECWPLMLSGLFVMVYMRIDQIMIRTMLDERRLGVYAAAVSLSQVWHFLPMIASISLMPILTARKSSEGAHYEDLYVKVFRYHAIGGVVLAGATALLAPILVGLVYGDQYQEAVAVLRVHSFTNVFVFLGVAHSIWMTGEGKSAVRLLGTLVAGVFSIGANAVLLPRYGLVAAAAVAICSQFIVAVGVNFFLARKSFWMQVRAIGLSTRP